MGKLEPVPVTLAGDAKQQWLRTTGGTLVVPPNLSDKPGTAPPQTILPLGSLVETLGCKLSWSRRRGLKVTHPTLGVLNTGLSSSHCPMVQEDQALQLIAELEARRLDSFREDVQNLECRIESLGKPPDPTESLKVMIGSGCRKDVLQALMAQPYLDDLSDGVKAWMAEDFGSCTDEDGWKLLKGFPLRRSKRRTLLQSDRWLVHLCAGTPRSDDPIRQWCDANGVTPVYVDLLAPGAAQQVR